MTAPAALAQQAEAADYAAFLRALDSIPAGSYFSVDDLRPALDPLQLAAHNVGAFFKAAFEAGHLLPTDRVVVVAKASRRGGTARVWRKAVAR